MTRDTASRAVHLSEGGHQQQLGSLCRSRWICFRRRVECRKWTSKGCSHLGECSSTRRMSHLGRVEAEREA